ncbi:MAG: GDSL-type esterase/lipase family protein [Planctomycetia bacterium]|nr:GDSL-type esterase/lipase family protein [Planctomycetia bacterium]
MKFLSFSLMLLALFVSSQTLSAAPRQVVIYPLGDSITFGWSGVAPNHELPGGYRGPLFTDLAEKGIHCIYVGSSSANPSPVLTAAHQVQHDGWPGWRIGQIASHVKQWLAIGGPGGNKPAYPNFILLHIGTNDIIQHYDPKYPHFGEPETVFMHAMENRMTHLVIELIHLRPHARIIVAQIIPIGGVAPDGVSHDQEAMLFNHFIATKLVPACRKKGYHVSTVDEHAAFQDAMGLPSFRHLPDQVHPDMHGYKLMAKVWVKGILAILHRHTASR